MEGQAWLITIALALVVALIDTVVSHPVMRLPLTLAKLLWPASVVEPPFDRMLLSAAPAVVFLGGAIVGGRVSWELAAWLAATGLIAEQAAVIMARAWRMVQGAFIGKWTEDIYARRFGPDDGEDGGPDSDR